MVGMGRRKMVLPGLNAPVAAGKTVIEPEDVGPDNEFSDKVKEARKSMEIIKKFRDHPLERGWSGRKAHGRHAGPPDVVNEVAFEGFESTVLMLRPIFSMNGVLGRTKRMHSLVVTGNGNGLAGFADSIGNDPKATVRQARNKAGKSLVKVPLFDNHTVLHDFHSRYYFTTVFVERKPKGYGIRAHRIIKSICEAFGIKDLYAKAEGASGNQINVTKAFFLGLMNQRSYQEMADEKRLHLVEMRDENFNFPTVLASPTSGPVQDYSIDDESHDFYYFINNGRIRQAPRVHRNPFIDDRDYYKHRTKLDYFKNRHTTKLALAAKYGHTRVLDVFPYFKTSAASFIEEVADTNAATTSE